MAAPVKKVPFQPDHYPTVSPTTGELLEWAGDLLVLGIFQEALDLTGKTASIKAERLAELNKQLGGVIADFCQYYGFKAKRGTTNFTRLGKQARVVGVVGLGREQAHNSNKAWGPSAYKVLGQAVAAGAKAHKAKLAAVAAIPEPLLEPGQQVAGVGEVASGIFLGGYAATRFKSSPEESPLEEVEVFGIATGSHAVTAVAAVKGASKEAAGVMLARYLVEAPANYCTPQYLADIAVDMAEQHRKVLKCQVLGREECEAQGMGLFLGVAHGSAHPPQFIHLTYTPIYGAYVKARVAIVGKGITFDSGGYNLKVGCGIEHMKTDMGGGAAVLGAAKAIAGLAPKNVEVHFIVAACENMVDGGALHPSDILIASNGKSVEVNDTDAEGRLTVADSLVYAEKVCGATAILDIATLTGACLGALGDSIGGLFTPSDHLADSLLSASRAAGEKIWRMPLEEEYAEYLESPIADLKNYSERKGGAITAALFLKEFVSDAVQWGHLDMAGPVWNDKEGGATGWGVATLTEWAISQGR